MRKWLFFIPGFLCGMSELFSQWNTNTQINNLICSNAPFLTNTIEDSKAFQMVNDGSGGVFIAWRDLRNFGTTSYDIFVQHINAAGITTWTPDGLTVCNATGTQYHPHLTADGSGGVVITWDDARSGSYDVYAQHIDANGNALWGTNGMVICSAPGSKQYPRVIRDENGDFTFTWRDPRNNIEWAIYAQKVDATGNILWANNGIPVCSTPVSQYTIPRMVTDGNNGVIICWEDVRNGGGGNSRNYVQRLLANGTAAWQADGVKLNDQYGSGCQMISDGNNGAIISFASSTQLYAQRIDPSGNLVWPSAGLLVYNGNAGFPQLATDGSNGCIITWYENRWNGTQYKNSVITQRINAAGSVQWGATGVLLSEDFYEYDYPQIAADGNGGAIVCWANNNSGTGEKDIYAQRISSSGSTQWISGGKIVCNALRNQTNPLIIGIGSGNSILTWVDDRNAGPIGIYSSRLLANGTLPVSLVDFYGKIETGVNKLFWTTANEQNNNGFEIERSNDGISYQKIGFVAGQLNSTSLRYYSFNDMQPPAGKNYYRLNQLDHDNNFRYSKIILLNNVMTGILTIFPNPAISYITIQTNETGFLQITDVSGRVVKTIAANGNSITADINQLPVGIYYCRAGMRTVSFIKQ